MDTKIQELKDFIDRYKYLPEQRSEQWLKDRRYSIGGSEIATVLRINKYQIIKDLIKQKLNLVPFKSFEALWFGCIFEEVIKQYSEIVFKTEIYEAGGIPYEKNNILKYSPDGLAVVESSVIDDVIDIGLESEYITTLFEFKCPFSRVINHDKIPDHYVPQPLMGMEVINICEFGLFIEAVFRFCNSEDLENNKYIRFKHYDKVRFGNPLYYGCMSLYYNKDETNENLINLIDVLRMNMSNDFITDNIENELLSAVMKTIIDYKLIKIRYHKIYKFDENIITSYSNRELFESEISNVKNDIVQEGHEYLGVLCFKMFDKSIKPVYKKNILTDDVLEDIENVIAFIKKMDSRDEIDMKDIDEYNKLYRTQKHK